MAFGDLDGCRRRTVRTCAGLRHHVTLHRTAPARSTATWPGTPTSLRAAATAALADGRWLACHVVPAPLRRQRAGARLDALHHTQGRAGDSLVADRFRVSPRGRRSRLGRFRRPWLRLTIVHTSLIQETPRRGFQGHSELSDATCRMVLRRRDERNLAGRTTIFRWAFSSSASWRSPTGARGSARGAEADPRLDWWRAVKLSGSSTGGCTPAGSAALVILRHRSGSCTAHRSPQNMALGWQAQPGEVQRCRASCWPRPRASG